MAQKQNNIQYFPGKQIDSTIFGDKGLDSELKALYSGLTERQARFVDLWNGNGTETAKMAGYSHPKDAGIRCVKHVAIGRLIRAKRASELKPEIMTRIERQRFWSKIIADPEVHIKYRLKASELLGKSEGDFIDRYVDESGPKVIKVGFVDDLGILSDTDMNRVSSVVAGISLDRIGLGSPSSK